MGWWRPGGESPAFGAAALREALLRLNEPVYVVEVEGRLAVAAGGTATLGAGEQRDGGHPLRGYVPPLPPSQLGDGGFRAAHGLRYAHVAGAMANGIASERIVEAMAHAGMMGVFGAAGCSLERVEAAIDRIQGTLGIESGQAGCPPHPGGAGILPAEQRPELPWGFNLIHSPNEPGIENAVVDLYLRRGVRRVSASAYLNLTPALVRYRVTGIHVDPATGRIVAPNRVVAKVSRAEVAQRFFSPPPANLLAELVRTGAIDASQAELAARIPMAEDLTAEADSGGHTDNRPAITLLPSMLTLRDQMAAKHRFDRPLRVGLAGGIATPASVAGAFAMGAAYVLTGSINQACVEAGTSDAVRQMLAEAGSTDVIMAPAADMFEMGVNLQVLRRGTMFAQRARRLYEVYRSYESLEALPGELRESLEREIFREPLEAVWAATADFFRRRDPSQLDRAQREPRHRMALVFRSYLGRSSKWANAGDADRRADYQVWCGPAMGAFNDWARGSFLEDWRRREVATVALNLMVGAAVLTRVGWLRAQGVPLPPTAERFEPMERQALEALLRFEAREERPEPSRAGQHPSRDRKGAVALDVRL
jgi:PfaD family protein